MNYNVIEFFELEKSKAILLNSVIEYLLIELKNGEYSAAIYFNLPSRHGCKSLKIYFKEITGININQTLDSVGQQIHNYKFIIYKDFYYLSLDPDESSSEISEEDQDFILFKELNAILE